MRPSLSSLESDAEAQARLRYSAWSLIASEVCDPRVADAGRRRRALARSIAEEVGALRGEPTDGTTQRDAVDGDGVISGFRARAQAIVDTWNSFDRENEDKATSVREVLTRARQAVHAMDETRMEIDALEEKSIRAVRETLVGMRRVGDDFIEQTERVGLGERHEAEKTSAVCLEKEAVALEKKLELITLEASNEAYTPDKRKALELISKYASNMLRQDTDQLHDVRQQLERYKSLGPTFQSMALEYTRLLAEEKSKKRVLKELHHAPRAG